MPALQPARGTQDLLPETARRHRMVSETARRLGELYGFAEIATPIFEFTEVFSRPIGEHTDIVSKEMYNFTDRGGEELTLRPENTAGVVRAVLSNGLTQSIPLKYFYSGPMFRYERPQRGRFRQFHQIGVEILGVAQAQADVECIALAWRILKELGIDKNVELQVNTLGDAPSRARYRAILVDYYTSHRSKLSEDSQRRLTANPLRILDSKDPGDIEINASAPTYDMYLNEESNDFFHRVLHGVGQLGIIETKHNPRLVRGLDYYAHTVFEFVTTDLGAQGTVLAGGRYDGLVELMGGPQMPGIGWAAGIERLALLIAEPPTAPRAIALVPIGEAAEAAALDILQSLRAAGIRAEMAYRGNLRRRMERANRIGARAAVIIGDNDLAQGVAQVKNLATGEQEAVPLPDVAGRLG
ncbi:MAG: histidine--tRNA ligase [Stellaceae bacterium]